MIINIRGTSGSGKSTLARRVMGAYTGCRNRVKQKGRKQPIGYICTRPDGGKPLYVLGHYESPCGGCDTIKTYDEVFQRVRDVHEAGYDVLFEGLLLSTETQRVIELALELPTLIIGLDVPVDVCLESINTRRRVKKPDAEPVNPKGTESKHRTNQRAMAKFQGLELQAEWHDRDGAFKRICGVLGL